ncbi:MAG: PspC domain-containing protein [Ignavibacteriae bacterium]|nr:PspC domain-containing protein [Ignavibacteriota bacterium]NOG97967.1 PspC domain-containing protein [Ignavibacteriota bacterium]
MNLKRSNDRYLAGVCGGLAEQFGVSPFLMRVLYAAVSFITFVLPGLIVYIVLWNTMEKPDE